MQHKPVVLYALCMMDRVKNLGFTDKVRGYLAVHARDRV